MFWACGTFRLSWGRMIWDKLGSFFTFQGNHFHRVSSCSIISTIFSSAQLSQCRRNVPSGSEASATDESNPKLALEPSLARQGRSSLVPITAPKESTPIAKAATVPGRRRHCMALFWRRRAGATNCGRQVVLTCRRGAASSSSFCTLWGGLIIMDGCLAVLQSSCRENKSPGGNDGLVFFFSIMVRRRPFLRCDNTWH